MKKFLKRNPFLTLLLFMLPGLGAGVLFSLFYNRFDQQQIQTFLDSFGYGAAAVFILLFTVRTFFIFAPYYVMLVIGGSLFGRKYGLLYNFTAVILSSTLAFILSKNIRKIVQKHLHFEKYDQYINMIGKHGFKILVFMRLTIIFPFDIINYAAGFAGMQYRKYILANILGVLPELIFLTCFGQSLRAPKSVQFVVLSAILLTVLIAGYRYKTAINKWIRSVQ